MYKNLYLEKLLLFFFAAFSGFAVLPYTKVGGIQIFVIIAVVLTAIYIFSGHGLEVSNQWLSYKRFVIFSFPALLISLYYQKYDAIYFYIYTLIPLILSHFVSAGALDKRKFLLASEISLIAVICLGWMIYFGILPFNFVYPDVPASEIELGYWGISYLPSTRNHDYMYVFSCACISFSLSRMSASRTGRRIQSLIFFLCLITLLATLSRGAMIISIWLFYVYFKNADKKTRVTTAIILLTVIVANISLVYAEFTSTFKNIFLSIFGLRHETVYGSQFSNANRKIIYLSALEHIIINPIGYGIQNYSIINDYGGGSAENAYLTIFVERGWLAGFFFVKFLIDSFRKATRGSLKYLLSSCLLVYFLFNYEFTSYMCVFVFYMLLVPGLDENDATY